MGFVCNLTAKEGFTGEFIHSFALNFWEMTREDSVNPMYPFQFVSVSKERFRFFAS